MTDTTTDSVERNPVVVIPALELDQVVLDNIKMVTDHAHALGGELVSLLCNAREVGMVVDPTLERHPIRCDEWTEMAALIPGYAEMVDAVHLLAEMTDAYDKDDLEALRNAARELAK